MMTWLPAIVAIVEENKTEMCTCWRRYSQYILTCIDKCGVRLQENIIKIVRKFKYLLVVFFGMHNNLLFHWL